jgi:DNA-binding NarL/FixJ family response regulator
MPSVIKILIVDDHAIVREGLKSLLELETDISVIGEASSSVDCFDQLENCRPHVIVIDLKMPGISGLEATRTIKNMYPHIKIILLTNYDDEEYVQEAVKVKVDAYVLKDIKKGDLVRVIRMVHQGEMYIDPGVMWKAFPQKDRQDSFNEKSTLRFGLSQRELQILELIVEGKSNKEIAGTIYLSLDTVKSHMKNIYQKLNVHSRSQAAMAAIQKGFVYLSR